MLVLASSTNNSKIINKFTSKHILLIVDRQALIMYMLDKNYKDDSKMIIDLHFIDYMPVQLLKASINIF